MTSACDTNPDRWMSDEPADIEAAKFGCEECPLSRFKACQAEGWKHEFGVFGGLSHHDRKALNALRYATTVKALNNDADRTDRQIMADRLAAKVAEVSAAQEMGGKSPREQAMVLVGNGLSSREVADSLGVNAATVRYWKSQNRTDQAA
ncbi:WhiB family transcriptional regulator [Micromonospora sp. NPDC049101]|uniref:WhiB family transcriptional regulator n=1 Tax=Micromonospora sp. NPDC049101 TaxID=3155032 RepID=UPI003406D4F7